MSRTPSSSSFATLLASLFVGSAGCLVGCGGATELDPFGTVDGGGTDTSTDGTSDVPFDGSCTFPDVKCGSTCTNLDSDPKNCGACGKSCAVGEFCAIGACSATCSAPLLKCGDRCVDPARDPDNCGGCGTKCADGEVCGPTGCGVVCPAPLASCGKTCADTANDPKNCGGCGLACGADEVCIGSKCSTTCGSPLKKCGLKCVDTAYDPRNCGLCGNVCPGTACIEGGCGEVDKTDDDGDTISNFYESKSDKKDTDKDGTPDYLDLDSDGDGMTDKQEAGDDTVVTPPIDTDGDTIPDFQDLDSDNDGLSDKDEFNKYKTSPTKPDTDGDGYTDAEEIAAGTDPLDPKSNPGTIGGFSFDLPYKGLPRTQEFTFKPQIKKADVAFVIDTTGSMGGTITGLKTSLSSIASSLKTKIPDVAIGVGDHRDMPINPYGSPGDFPFKLWQRVTTSLTDAQTGVNKLTPGGGNDIAESQIEGLYQAAVGSGFNAASGAVWTPKFNPTVGFDAAKGHGDIGGMGFRKDSAPIFILATDAIFHRLAGDPDNAPPGGDMAFYNASSFGSTDTNKPHTVKQAVDAITKIGGKFIGINVILGFGGQQPRRQEEYFAIKTSTTVPSTDGSTCPHGVSGGSVPAVDDGTGKKVCPLVFDSNTSGTGIDTAIVDAITKLTTFVNFKTVWLEARDNTTTTFDETKFFKKGIPVSFSTPLPAGCTAPSTADLLPAPTGDGVFDSFTNLCPGTVVSFSLVMQNVDIPATCSDQVFSFKIVVIGDKTVETDARVVTVRVPGNVALCKP
ncbi:MAG: hypothetical protein IPJ34_10985 [Myxococcales bacterium]|nr:hypothetical protein [Myxococcales bacterium]